jgi:large subunit ribosomal protein L9
MKVVFIEEVPGTAVPGEVKDVRDGFARNYLLPRHLAVPATKSAMQRAESLAKKEEKRQAGLDAEAQRIVEKLEGQRIVIRARVGDQGRLYGSVTANDIARQLEEILDEPIDRRRIVLPAPIREVGSRQVVLRLTRNISAPIEVVIEEDETSTRGRRSNAPAGGSIIMAPRRGRPRGEEEPAAEAAAEDGRLDDAGADVDMEEPAAGTDAIEPDDDGGSEDGEP